MSSCDDVRCQRVTHVVTSFHVLLIFSSNFYVLGNPDHEKLVRDLCLVVESGTLLQKTVVLHCDDLKDRVVVRRL